MDPNKAPNLKGFPPSFFQKYWRIVGPLITKFLLDIFRIGVLPYIVNDSNICLIPKLPAPEMLVSPHFIV